MVHRPLRHDLPLLILLLVALGLLVAGLSVPMVSVSSLGLFGDRVSVLDILGDLWAEDEYFLFAIVGLFSVVFPLAKLGYGLFAWWARPVGDPRLRRSVEVLDRIGKWSMLDVFLVALLVASLKLSLVSEATVLPGLYFFLASIVLSLVALWRLRRLAGDHSPGV